MGKMTSGKSFELRKRFLREGRGKNDHRKKFKSRLSRLSEFSKTLKIVNIYLKIIQKKSKFSRLSKTVQKAKIIENCPNYW